MATRSRTHPFRPIGLALSAVAVAALLAGCGGGDEPAASATASGSTEAAAGREVLLEAQELTVLDQPIKYSKKTPAQVSSYIISLEPGQETGWHRHRVPLYAYVLEGTVTVDYDAGVTKEFAAGTAFLEAIKVWHNGINKSDVPVRILTVYMGAQGAKNTVERSP